MVLCACARVLVCVCKRVVVLRVTSDHTAPRPPLWQRLQHARLSPLRCAWLVLCARLPLMSVARTADGPAATRRRVTPPDPQPGTGASRTEGQWKAGTVPEGFVFIF